MPTNRSTNAIIPDRYAVYAMLPGKHIEYRLVMVTLDRGKALDRATGSLDAFVVNGGPKVAFRHTLSDMDARNAVKVV